ncbi:MAG: GTP-binding protein [Oscillospiraceae bacterium]|jgi:G3E family GTPase|nr:GTP-binding protein [Oscillospiraceae bacterium]
MRTEITIISGFLGAGKTTLIQKMLTVIPQTEKVVLVENDFGDVSVDAALLKSSGIEVKEINAGCICCSLSGDFIKALKELLERYQPTKVIIEPSGVGKLSDIVKACSDLRILPMAKVVSKITLVDVKRCKMYLDNFGEFFEDQIQNADRVVLNRSEESAEKAAVARELVKELAPHAAIFASMDELLATDSHKPEHSHRRAHRTHTHDHGAECSCGHDHDHEHEHAAEEVFDTVTVRTNRVFSADDLEARVSVMQKNAKGTILRAKGIVRGAAGYLNLQYLPDDIKVEECTATGDALCVIGRGIDKEELCALFGGE